MIQHLKKNYLRAIFGDKAGDVKDASLKVSPSVTGLLLIRNYFLKLLKDRNLKQLISQLIEQLDEKHQKAK